MFKKSDAYIFKKLGYSIDQEGILSRFLREGTAWNSHLNNTKNWIIENCIQDQYKSITIIGSGWLLDLPITEILAHFEHIYLIDVIHPQQIKHKYRKQTNLHFIQADITGGMAREVYYLLFKTKSPKSTDIQNLKTTPYSLPKSDIVVSLNILNQLDILLFDEIQEVINVNKEDEVTFRTRLQAEHIALLEKTKYCLISDWTQKSVNKEYGNITTKDLVIVSPPAHKAKLEWQWHFDSHGLYEDESEVFFDVKAYSNIN